MSIPVGLLANALFGIAFALLIIRWLGGLGWAC
jgi:hypothetical protein